MAAKGQWYRDAWWVMTHAKGRRWRKRVGATKAHKREATEIGRKINAALALGTFSPKEGRENPLPMSGRLREWHQTYSATFKPSFEQSSRILIEKHLVPIDFKSAPVAVRQRDGEGPCALAVRSGLLG